MKSTTQKRARRILKFYQTHFGFVPPYRVITDGNFIQEAVHFHIFLKEQLPKVLHNNTTIPMVTHEIVSELRALGEKYSGAAITAKQYQHVKPLQQQHAKHKSENNNNNNNNASETTEEVVSVADSILAAIGERNENHYMVATQDEALRVKLRNIGGVPIMYFMSNRIILENPSAKSLEIAKKITGAIAHQGLTEEDKKVAEELLVPLADPEEKKRKEAEEADKKKKKRRWFQPKPTKKKKGGQQQQPQKSASGEPKKKKTRRSK